jgi:carotenoid 1,2-hydratase
VGPSGLEWDGNALTIRIRERSAPIPRAVEGTIRLFPEHLFNWDSPLDAAGHHRWGPIATRARIEVDFKRPGVRWSGHGYLDSNEGDEPIEDCFESWDWSRTVLADGDSALLYDLRESSGSERLLALRFGRDGSVKAFDPGPRWSLGKTGWRVERAMRSDADGAAPSIVRTLEDTPFYARSLARSFFEGQSAISMHETLSAPRLRSPVVRLMLPWRMPRRV